MSTHGKTDGGTRESASRPDGANGLPVEFLESLGSELRSTLNSILGFAQLSLRDAREPLPHRHKLRMAHVVAGGEHLLRVLDDAILLSRIESGLVPLTIESFDLADLVDEVIVTLAPVAALAGVKLEHLTPGFIARVDSDRERARQVLLKLGTNAIQYSRGGATVSFVISIIADRVRIAVVDTGPGVPGAVRADLSEPASSERPRALGAPDTRLGLAVAKRAAQDLGARLGHRDIPARGSESWMELPYDDSSSRSGLRAVVSVDRSVLENSPATTRTPTDGETR